MGYSIVGNISSKDKEIDVIFLGSKNDRRSKFISNFDNLYFNDKCFYKEYESLAADNKKILDKAKFLFEKIQKLRSIDKKLLTHTNDEHSRLERTLTEFEKKYTELNKLQKPYTAIAQEEHGQLLVESGKLRMISWSFLGIMLSYIIIHHLKD